MEGFIFYQFGIGTVYPLIVDALATGGGQRITTRDVIGAGPRSIAGVLEAEGFSVKIVSPDMLLKGNVETSAFNVLFVSGMSSDSLAVRRVVSKWRSGKNKPVIIGGPIVSELERTLHRVKADLGVVGEGEATLHELLEYGLASGLLPPKEKLANISGIIYHDNGVKVNQLRPYSRRPVFDSFKPSTSVVTDYRLYKSSRVYVEVVRGCSNYHRSSISEGKCIECKKCLEGGLTERYYCPAGVPPGCGYCSVPSLYGPPRSRSTENLFKEISELVELGVRRVVLSAPGFLDYGRDLLVEPEPLTDPRNPEPNYDMIEELLVKLHNIESISTGKVAILLENVKGCLVTPMGAKLLGRYLKGSPVNIGFETGSVEHSRFLGRPSLPNENLKAVKMLSDAGLKPYVYFIHGLPGQNIKTVKDTVKTMRRVVEYGAKRIILYRFSPLPFSAFEGYPLAPPAKKNWLSKKIYEAASSANMMLKKELINKELQVVIAEQYDRDSSFYVAYPLLHGPVVLIKGKFEEGDLVTVKITNIISDRLVEGHVLDARF